MSLKGAEILNTLEELITSTPDIKNPNNIEALDYVNIQNTFHNKILFSIKSNMAKEIAYNNPQDENDIDSNIFREKIKYKSKLKTENLNKIINLEIFNNIPSNKSLNLLNNFQTKANNILNKSKKEQEEENNNIINNEQKDDRANINSYFDRKNKIKSNFNANKSQDKFSYGSGSYMDIRPVNGKKKRYNNQNDDDNDEDESENKNGYSAYANSIYNINKKKKNKRKRYNNKDDDEENEEEENNYNNNKKRSYNYKRRNWKNNKYDEQDDEEEENNNIQNNALPPAGGGFVSAITITNAVFKNKISNSYVEKLESSNNNNNNNSNNTNSNSGSCFEGRKKFVPPTKNKNKNSSSANKYNNNNQQSAISKVLMSNPNLPQLDESKQAELEEKLKGFDEKMIEFIQSEILSSSPDVQWDDIAGLEFAKKTIKEIIIWPMLKPEFFSGIRSPPKGLLLFGPPGTGKTMIAKAIASQSKSMFFNISASSLMSKWIGESEKLVRTLFALASFYQPSVVFIDEIDSLLTSRSENENEASRRIKTEFLVQLDGAGTNINDRILIIGATNRPQEIDDAFVRRLSKRLYIPLPNKVSRKQLIMRVLEKERKNNNKYEINENDIDDIVNRTKGYSGSDLINVCKEAAMMPIRSIEDITNCQLEHLRGVNKQDFDEALTTVKPSINEKSIEQYMEWNKNFGSFQIENEEE
jgi:SpoVK/Ycf46/Vps4 family AAA+-type ATPase